MPDELKPLWAQFQKDYPSAKVDKTKKEISMSDKDKQAYVASLNLVNPAAAVSTSWYGYLIVL